MFQIVILYNASQVHQNQNAFETLLVALKIPCYPHPNFRGKKKKEKVGTHFFLSFLYFFLPHTCMSSKNGLEWEYFRCSELGDIRTMLFFSHVIAFIHGIKVDLDFFLELIKNFREFSKRKFSQEVDLHVSLMGCDASVMTYFLLILKLFKTYEEFNERTFA